MSATQITGFDETNIVSDGSVPAAQTDPNLINPWGVSYAPTGPFWVSDNGTGVTTIYDGTGQAQTIAGGTAITIPVPSGSAGTSAPTGQVFNSSGGGFTVSNGSSSGSAIFLFASEDGTISGWNPTVSAASAVTAVDNSASGAVYKGLTLGTTSSGTFLYAANFNAGKVEVYDSSFQLVNSFTDPSLPAGYAPFNVQVLNGKLYVTFALQSAGKHDDVAGSGHGYVNAFDLNGNLLARVASQGALNSPWGLDIAPATFGQFANALLVGNFGDGTINAFDPNTGASLGQMLTSQGTPLVIGDLWALTNGNGARAGSPNDVYFTAAVADEAHGLFGSLAAGTTTVSPGLGNNLVTLGGGSSVVASTGTDTIVAGAGTATVRATGNNSDVTFGGSGHLVFVNGTGSSSVFGGSGQTTIFTGGGGLFFGSSGGSAVFGGAGAMTVIGAGADTIDGGAGGGLFFASRGGNSFLSAGSGAATLVGSQHDTLAGGSGQSVLFGGGEGNLLLGGAGADTLVGGGSGDLLIAGNGGSMLVAGAGNETLISGGGNDIVFTGSGANLVNAGSGRDTVFAASGSATVVGGSGQILLEVVNGHAGGTDVFIGFRSGQDQIGLQGYGADAVNQALQSATMSGGSESLMLADGTKLVFLGVTGLGSTDFTPPSAMA